MGPAFLSEPCNEHIYFVRFELQHQTLIRFFSLSGAENLDAVIVNLTTLENSIWQSNASRLR